MHNRFASKFVQQITGRRLFMKDRIFVIGASLSGIDALCELVSRLPAEFPAPILIARHVAPHSPGMLPYLLSKAGPAHAAPMSGSAQPNQCADVAACRASSATTSSSVTWVKSR